MQSEAEGSDTPEGFGSRIALLIRLFVWHRDILSVCRYVGEEQSHNCTWRDCAMS